MAIEPLTPQPRDQNPSPMERERVQTHCVEQVSHIIGQLEQQIQQQRQRQHLIDQIVNAIRSSHDLDQVYQLTVKNLVQTMQVGRVFLLMFKYADPRYRNRTSNSIPKTKATVVAEALWAKATLVEQELSNWDSNSIDQAVQPSFWASECSLCQLILQGQPEVSVSGLEASFNSSVHSPTSSFQPDSLFQIDAFASCLLLPLESQGTILGCLVLQHDHPKAWTDDDIGFVRLVAAQLSTAIIQTRSFQQVQAVVQERTAQLQRSLEVQAKLYEKTRQQVEQLRKLNEEREEFLSTISHELLTPLTSMTLAIRMLRQANLDDERRSKYLNILEQQCVQETHLINDMLALRKLESASTPMQVQRLDLRQLMQDVVESVESGCREKDLKLLLNLPSRPLILYTDGESLHRILVELLTNAKKYSDPSSAIELTVASEGDLTAHQVVVSVRNIGAGITPDELPHIFDKFRRGRGVTKQAIQGTGLGLALVKSLVEHLDGTIAAASHPLEGNSSWETCFTITLPQANSGRIHAIA